MDSPNAKLRLEARNVNLYQAARYQASPTHSRVYQPQYVLDSGSMDYFSEPSLPPTDLLSPRKHRELYDTSGLAFSDVTGSPSHFAHMINSPVRNVVQTVSPYQSPLRPVPVSPYHSPIKPGFTKIEHSPLVNVTMTDNPDWSPGRSAQPIRSRTELRFTPQKQTLRTVLYANPIEQHSPVHSPCKLMPKETLGRVPKPAIYKLEEKHFSPCKIAPRPLPMFPVEEEKIEPVDNLDFLLQKLSEEDALQAVQPLLDENQNVLPGEDLLDGGGSSVQPTTSKMVDFMSPNHDVTSPTGVLLSGSQVFDVPREELEVGEVGVDGVEEDVDVDVLIGEGDINITLSSWDEEKDEGNSEFPCNICAKTFRRRSALSFHQCLHTGDSNSSSPPSRPSSRSQPLDSVDGASRSGKTKTKIAEKNAIMPPPKRERSFLCEHCGERFPSISTRTNHLNVCDKSSQSFPPSLLKYLGTAEDGRLMCAVCCKIFNHKSTLKTHIRVHTGEKPCKCRFCGKYYRDHSTLSKHYRVHTNEKPYKCTECMRCFSQSGNMRRHMIHVHKIALPPDASTLRQDESASPRKRPIT